ncbi:peptidylprolyl isomerase [Qipengyuania sp.]|uniref:peptidylprolyl isomerase n=1 Tax=Qipengyuania sp. TaxID=2004515 RepID=UPI003AF9A349
MTRPLLSLAALLALAAPALAQDEEEAALSPGEIVAQAPAAEWIGIAPEDLLVMTLAPAPDGSERKVVIQLMPAPFSQGWVENIRTLARAHWYDGITVNRVQDNYVVQWGDPNYDNPEAEGQAKALPEGLKVMSEAGYTAPVTKIRIRERPPEGHVGTRGDAYGDWTDFHAGWPIASNGPRDWPVHCYGMVGVGRNMSPDTGTGAELYTVIGQAPRHLDRNIALAGRIVEGMEYLSSLPRGHGDLGFYTAEEADKRTAIVSVRVASDLPEGERPAFEYLSTDGETFARYADARANRRDPFFITPAGGADICNIPVPVRRVAD